MFMLESERHSPRQLRGILDWQIRPRLLSVEGVADVNSLGGEVRSFLVTPRPGRLRVYDLGVADINAAIARNNVVIPNRLSQDGA